MKTVDFLPTFIGGSEVTYSKWHINEQIHQFPNELCSPSHPSLTRNHTNRKECNHIDCQAGFAFFFIRSCYSARWLWIGRLVVCVRELFGIWQVPLGGMISLPASKPAIVRSPVGWSTGFAPGDGFAKSGKIKRQRWRQCVLSSTHSVRWLRALRSVNWLLFIRWASSGKMADEL